MLPADQYIQAIELTQLVSIDLVLLKNVNGIPCVLVGKRKNEPAKDTWFVPGSRLYKNEPWKRAVERVSMQELGFKIPANFTTFIGVFDHIYPTNFMNKIDPVTGKYVNTHYLCIGLRYNVDDFTAGTPNGEPRFCDFDEKIFADQHNEIQWMPITSVISLDNVHQNTKNYFLPDSYFSSTIH